MSAEYLDGRVVLHAGDSLDVLPTLAENSIDSVVCDPPYHLHSIVKRFAKTGRTESTATKSGPHQRTATGFMGKRWDGGDVAFRVETWTEVLRVLKPGGYIVAFSGTRTYHRMACAIEDAGFDIRDQLGFAFGSGFPKSHNLSKAAAENICRCGTASIRQHDLRSLRDSDVPAPERDEAERREVLLNRMQEQGPSAARREQLSATEVRGAEPCVEGWGDLSQSSRQLRVGEVRAVPAGAPEYGQGGRLRDGASQSHGRVGRSPADAQRDGASSRPQSAPQRSHEPGTVADEPGPQTGGAWPICGRCRKPIVPDGLGTALKPAWEPICLARKPIDGTNVENLLRWGTGALNIDACRIEAADDRAARYNGRPAGKGASLVHAGAITEPWNPTLGRWPANLIHDGSDEVLEAFPHSEANGGNPREKRGTQGNVYGIGLQQGGDRVVRNDAGSAARFFYTAKADADDRLGSRHPTIKPLDLMQYLCRLVTPPGGIVLDPFAGTGTTGEAAWREGFRAVLIEREPEYQADIARRMELAANPTKRTAVAKSKNNLQGAEGTPLFDASAA